MHRVVAQLVVCGSCAAAHAAATCDELQRTIEARIRANGVAEFTVTPVDTAASAPGQVVGTCEQGKKKLLYLRGSAAAASPPAQSTVPNKTASAPAVITECADGRVLTQGSCKP